MIVLKTIAPVLTDLTSVAGSAEQRPGQYAELWRAVGTQLPAELLRDQGIHVHLEHAEQVVQRSRYSSLEEDALTRVPHLLTFTTDPVRFLLSSELEFPENAAIVDEITFRVYPHGVSLLEITTTLTDAPAQGKRDEDGRKSSDRWLDDAQHAAVTFAELVAREMVSRALNPTSDAIGRSDRKGSFFRVSALHPEETARVMWASRSLLVEPGERWLLEHWTRSAVDAEHEHLRDAVLNGEADTLMRWLNYAFVDKNSEGVDAFRLDGGYQGTYANHYAGLRYAQYIYSALDHVGRWLGTVLAEAVGVSTKWQLESLKDDLVYLSQRAELIIMERQDLLKYMNRSVRAHFKNTLDAWDYYQLIEEPVQFKIELCNRRLRELSEKRAARSNLVTDLILLGIGITSIAGMAIALTDFGRSSASSAISTVYDLGASSFTDWFMTQPIDVILLASAAASTVLIVLYLFFRRDNGT